jgi:hypothetical protein
LTHRTLTHRTTLNPTPQLVYLVFGAQTYHQEAVFSIASALSCLRQSPGQALEIQVFTDDPQPYQALPVRVRPLDAQTRKAWSAPHGYPFRCKHVALRLVLEDCERAVLIDTDTFFHRSPLTLFERIKPRTLLCNAFNMRYDQYPESPLYQVLAPTLRQRAMADDEMPLLNSGVIGLEHSDIELLDRAIALMDEFYPQVQGAYTLEEFCLSVATYRSQKVTQCPDLIHHYWSRKQLFRAKIRAWLRKHGADPTRPAALDDTQQVTTRLPRPPRWQRLLYKAATLGVPGHQRQFVREILYGCCKHDNEFDQACSPVWWEKARDNVEQRLKHPLHPHQLEDWLNHWVVRRILGQRRKAIYEHLMQRTTRP